MTDHKRLANVIPKPKSVEAHLNNGEYVDYHCNTSISSSDKQFEKHIDVFVQYALKLNGINFTRGDCGIILNRDNSLKDSEYRIECRNNGIFVHASDDDGIFSAFATLHQIIEVHNGILAVPGCTLEDSPDCHYRALLLDLARQWHPFETLKVYIDLCYLYKIKFFHIHFTDSQSYTLPSNILPKLSTEGRSYSFDEIEELNKYAIERGIEIIPELDVPGHAAILTTSYPELFANTVEDGPADKNVICVGKPGLMDNLSALFKELIEMFPNSRYIHVGGDEANISEWERCSDCNAYMEKHGIVGKYPLYTHFEKEITDLILSLGRTPVVFEGFPKEGAEAISRDVVVMAWESLYHLPNDLLDEGFTVINGSWMPLYIVPPTHHKVKGGRWQPEDILKWNIYTWKNWYERSAAYEAPIIVQPTDKVIGGTLCAWECNYDQDIIPVKENLAALSERLWNVTRDINIDEYKLALQQLWSMADRLIIDNNESR